MKNFEYGKQWTRVEIVENFFSSFFNWDYFTRWNTVNERDKKYSNETVTRASCN